jgi:fucokinase
LYSSFNKADVHAACKWQRELEQRVLSKRFIDVLETNVHYEDALNVFGHRGITESIYDTLLQDAQEAPTELKMRIYYALSRFMRKNRVKFHGHSYEVPEGLCFETLQKVIFAEAAKNK